MSTARFVLVAGAAAGLGLGAAPTASAYARQSGAAAGTPTYTVSQRTVKLSPVTVEGRPLILPLFLQVVKTALHRPWSSKWSDRDKLVCRFPHIRRRIRTEARFRWGRGVHGSGRPDHDGHARRGPDEHARAFVVPGAGARPGWFGPGFTIGATDPTDAPWREPQKA